MEGCLGCLLLKAGDWTRQESKRANCFYLDVQDPIVIYLMQFPLAVVLDNCPMIYLGMFMKSNVDVLKVEIKFRMTSTHRQNSHTAWAMLSPHKVQDTLIWSFIELLVLINWYFSGFTIDSIPCRWTGKRRLHSYVTRIVIQTLPIMLDSILTTIIS